MIIYWIKQRNRPWVRCTAAIYWTVLEAMAHEPAHFEGCGCCRSDPAGDSQE
jgi:hypothetical protein